MFFTIILFYLQTEKSLELLDKFEKMSGPNLELKDKYCLVLNNYAKDLESVKKTYQNDRMDPTIPRNIPPISGRISWARQLYRKIETPIKIFKAKTDLLKVCHTVHITSSLLKIIQCIRGIIVKNKLH